MLLFIHSRKTNYSIEKLAKLYFLKIKDEKSDILLDIFNLRDLKNNFKLPLMPDPISFVKSEKYSEELVDGVLDVLIEFIKDVLGQDDEYEYGEEVKSYYTDEKSQLD